MLSQLRNGIYSLSYEMAGDDHASSNGGLVIVRDDEIHGSDPGGSVFNGTISTAANGEPRIHGHIIIGPHGELLTGLTAGPDGLRIDFDAIPSNSTGGGLVFNVEIAGTEIAVKAAYVGPLPTGLDKAALS